MRHAKKLKSMIYICHIYIYMYIWHYIETSEEAQMLGLADKDFKLAIINMLKKLKETVSKELKKTMK